MWLPKTCFENIIAKHISNVSNESKMIIITHIKNPRTHAPWTCYIVYYTRSFINCTFFQWTINTFLMYLKSANRVIQNKEAILLQYIENMPVLSPRCYKRHACLRTAPGSQGYQRAPIDTWFYVTRSHGHLNQNVVRDLCL